MHASGSEVQHTAIDALTVQMSHFCAPTKVHPSRPFHEDAVQSRASFESAWFGAGDPSCQPQHDPGFYQSSHSETIAIPQPWQIFASPY